MDKSKDKLDQLVSESRRARQRYEQGYRDQALKLFPHICGRCGREFTRLNLHELTVHHRDHDHSNNPVDVFIVMIMSINDISRRCRLLTERSTGTWARQPRLTRLPTSRPCWEKNPGINEAPVKILCAIYLGHVSWYCIELSSVRRVYGPCHSQL